MTIWITGICVSICWLVVNSFEDARDELAELAWMQKAFFAVFWPLCFFWFALIGFAAWCDEERNPSWYFWKFVHNFLIHPLLAFPWEPKWVQSAHDWTSKKCDGGG